MLLCGTAGRMRSQAPEPAAIPAYRHRLLGVFDGTSGAPVEGAQVTDVLNKISALTTATGTVTLVFLPDGGSLVRIQKIGYEPQTIAVSIAPADTAAITIVLNPLATRLDPVVTVDSAPRYLSPRLRGFEERRRSGMGRFISEAELRKSDASILSNVVRRIPGLNVTCRRGGCIATSTRMMCGGPVVLYLDGVRSVDRDLDKTTVDMLAGVEYYAGAEIPAEYNGTGSACGVLLLWTRER
jgi:hypothetical protein